MSHLHRRLEARLNALGWHVLQRAPLTRETGWIFPERWLLESIRSPRGVKVEADVRIVDDDWYEQFSSLTVRYPAQVDDKVPSPEATLVAGDVEANDYRQLARVLEWFHDPLSGVLWQERPLPGDWLPPASWEAERWGERVSLEYRWPVCTEPLDMLRYLPGRPDERKLRLVACACCRLLPLEMHHERNRQALDAALRHAEGVGPRREMKKLCKHSDLAWLAQLEALPQALRAVRQLSEQRRAEGAVLAADVIRDVMGNPYRPVSLRRSWLRNEGGVVAHLAEAIRGEGRHDDLPILADALEDAGCTNRDVLEHCRGAGRHVAGCWVLDLLRLP